MPGSPVTCYQTHQPRPATNPLTKRPEYTNFFIGTPVATKLQQQLWGEQLTSILPGALDLKLKVPNKLIA